MVELYAARHVRVSGLKSAAGHYTDWLLSKKRIFNRRRSLRQEDIERETRELFTTGEAQHILGNEKLASFLRSVAMERRVFDYLTLTLSPAPSLRRSGLATPSSP
jgi:hypothetical protein